MKAATPTRSCGLAASDISIHAAREGGDTKSTYATEPAKRISIHAAREGGDDLDKLFLRRKLSISIHAAREGGDRCR